MGKKKGVGKFLLGALKVVAPKTASTVEVIKQTKEAKKETLQKGNTAIQVFNYPAVQKALDINGDGKIDLLDAQALIELKRKELFKRLIPLLIAIAGAIIFIKYGVVLF